MSLPRVLRLAAAFSALALPCLGCGVIAELDDPLGRHHALTDTQRRYTNAIRWGALDEASEFVERDLRAAFLDKAGAFEGFRITDYQIGQIDYAEENADEARVSVTYRGYHTASLIEQPIRERQRWVRKGGNEWRVHPDFDLPIGALGRTQRAGDALD